MRSHVVRKVWPSLTVAILALLGVAACGGDGGSDSDATNDDEAGGGSASGGRATGGAPAGGAPAGGTGGLDCEQVDCFRAIECVEECGGAIRTSGCCPCPEGTFDSIACGRGGAGGAGAGGVGGVPAVCDVGCTPSSECDEDGIVWECGGSYDYEGMVDAGCVDLATGIQRFCCPLAAFADCLPRIEIDREVYALEEQIDPRWENPTDESIFLPGCGTVQIELRSGEAWEYLGPMVLCGWEGVAVEVPPGASYVDPLARFSEAGTYRLSGGYSVGCTPGEALSQAGCSRGPIPVVSRPFAVE